MSCDNSAVDNSAVEISTDSTTSEPDVDTNHNTDGINDGGSEISIEPGWFSDTVE